MAFKTFAPGVLTSSDVNTFLMRQAVITCTSSTRPASPSEGMTIYETDTDALLTYSGSAWENTTQISAWRSWTPTLGVDGAGTAWALGNGTNSSRYLKVGRTVMCHLWLEFGSTSTFGTGALMFTLPVARTASEGANQDYGSARLIDVGSAAPCEGQVKNSSNVANATLHAVDTAVSYGRLSAVTSTVPFTWASSDVVTASFIYEAAA